MLRFMLLFFFFSSRRRHTRFDCDWSSDVCSSDLVRNDGIVKVLDFGLARRLPAGGAWGSAAGDKITDPGTRVGTLLYMSPEQARAESVDAATDIFSLGLVLYELATGQHPFRADPEVGVLHAIVAQ